MTDTPIIDATKREGCAAAAIGGTNFPACAGCTCHIARAIVAALRAALPWEPSAETVDAMALAYSTDWHSANSDQRYWWRAKSLDAYRAQPLLRELHPEQFR